MITRKATLDDLDQLMALEHTIFPDDAWARELMAEGITHPYCHYMVVDSDGVIVAYAGAQHIPGNDFADIHNIAVIPAARGNGLGAELFDQLVDWCVKDGASRILLEVRADNEIAQNLYQSRGFTTIAVREGYYQPANVDAFVMERVVTA